jgi:hypothetical protein
VDDSSVGFLLDLLEVFGESQLATEALIGRRRRSRRPVSMMGLAFAGAAAGVLSAWLLPHRLFAARAVLPGASLLLAPLATGAAMHFLGKLQRRFGRCPGSLATFRGGAIFAFSMALIRWWLAALPR